MAVEYMTFQEVLEELQIDEEDLKRLVSNAELRGFRAGSSMKFKRDDVMAVKQGRETEPTIILTDSDQEMGIAESSDELILEDSTSDTVINIGDIMGGARSGSQQEIIFDTTEEYTVSPHDDSDPEAAIPTVEVPSVSEDLGMSGLSGQTESDAALVEVGSDESMETEAFELMDESGETDGMAVAEAGRPGKQPSQRGSKRAMSQSTRMRSLEVQQKQGHAAWTVMLLVGIMLASLQGSIQYSEILGTSPKWTNEVTGALREMVDTMYTWFN
ncbi:MAG: helix-turn-helix domain-containing protein [Planctomycetes bacterium]|nr:helix-turn-helix domain-containing protein [Planctomycetota bacterium]